MISRLDFFDLESLYDMLLESKSLCRFSVYFALFMSWVDIWGKIKMNNDFDIWRHLRKSTGSNSSSRYMGGVWVRNKILNDFENSAYVLSETFYGIGKYCSVAEVWHIKVGICTNFFRRTQEKVGQNLKQRLLFFRIRAELCAKDKKNRQIS